LRESGDSGAITEEIISLSFFKFKIIWVIDKMELHGQITITIEPIIQESDPLIDVNLLATFKQQCHD